MNFSYMANPSVRTSQRPFLRIWKPWGTAGKSRPEGPEPHGTQRQHLKAKLQEKRQTRSGGERAGGELLQLYSKVDSNALGKFGCVAKAAGLRGLRPALQ